MSYPNEEKQLVQACLKQDLLAQKMFYQRFAKRMMGVCMRYARTFTEAEDLLQEGFFRVFCDLEQYRGAGSLEGWVRRVIVNVALQHVRRRKDLFDDGVDLQNLPESANGYEESFHEFLREDLLKLLLDLPEGCRVIFNLYVLEEFSHQEIAEKLNITIGTSKSQLSKARNLLKEQFIKRDILV